MIRNIIAALIILFAIGNAGNALYTLLIDPSREATYFMTEGTIIEKSVEPKCTGMPPNKKCKDAPFIRYRYKAQDGNTYENVTESVCINWEAAEPGAKVHVGVIVGNPRSAKACDAPFEDPFALRPLVPIIASAFLMALGWMLWSSAKPGSGKTR